MNVIDFVTKVREMREAQKDYFQFRCAQTLGLAKSLERQVDAALEEGVTVYATETLKNSAPAESEQLGLFGVDFAADGKDISATKEWGCSDDIAVENELSDMSDEPDAADLLDLSGE